ncbi:MAG TPA: 5-methyltetrahydropteroyltriglutamate--homocysteine S-methyltransferase [Alphaproteobacteria bacterium]|nr:5-methyltetrahydropteroyltriglutamate--homocysteine S-methyltransferase [Alphaproteobacteria bacterium]
MCQNHAHRNPPFRAEHVGSLLRPRRLKEAYSRHEAGELDDDAYEQVVEDEIARAIRLQEDAGLQSITDGEFRRNSWFGFFFHGLDGLSLKDSKFAFKDSEGHTYTWPTCFFHGKIRRIRPICTPEFLTVQKHTSRTPKATMPSPSAFHFFRGRDAVDPKAYPDLEGFWDDLLAVYSQEIRELHEAGCRYIQFDEVPLAMLCDANVRQQVREQGEDPDAFIAAYVRMLQRVLAVVPEDVATGIHMCRGNFRSRWMAEGGYEAVAEQVFAEVPIDAFFLEYDSPRAGDFSPLRLMGKDKLVVLGMISTKSSELEDKDALKRRLDEAAQYVPLDRLALSPQCGFASVAGGNVLDEAQEVAKLRRVAEVAAEVWPQ